MTHWLTDHKIYKVTTSQDNAQRFAFFLAKTFTEAKRQAQEFYEDGVRIEKIESLGPVVLRATEKSTCVEKSVS